MKNIVTNKISEKARESVRSYYSFKLGLLDKSNCQYELPCDFGFVYGFAIKIENEKDVTEVYNSLCDKGRCNNKHINTNSPWEPIDDCYYPLYWGRAVSAKSRLIQHIKGANGTNSIILNGLDMLKKYDIIFGAVFCGVDYDKVEKKMHKYYPDILKTIKKVD